MLCPGRCAVTALGWVWALCANVFETEILCLLGAHSNETKSEIKHCSHRQHNKRCNQRCDAGWIGALGHRILMYSTAIDLGGEGRGILGEKRVYCVVRVDLLHNGGAHIPTYRVAGVISRFVWNASVEIIQSRRDIRVLTIASAYITTIAISPPIYVDRTFVVFCLVNITIVWNH